MSLRNKLNQLVVTAHVQYWVKSINSPSGKKTIGYLVTNGSEDHIAKFMSRDWPSWRIARDKAHALINILNR
jgi:hypothetical protein